ncbi:MAG: hypothetical protein Q8J71_01825, partial [Brevundimonas sp.]|nr:hypothetical protein [Brevundimonas sp.]
MTRLPRFAAVIAAGLVLSGCASAGPSLDRFEERVEARSTCHTSTGEFAPSPGCSISYSVTETKSTTTTTTTTTPAS